MKAHLAGVVAVLLLVLGLFWMGYQRGYVSGVDATQAQADAKVAKAQATASQATAERDATTQTLAQVRRTLASERTRLELANTYAAAALQDRNRLQHQLDTEHAQRQAALHDTATHQPDCTRLLHLPVCPAVAERLWGTGANDPAHPGH